jgi:hypothetical protein
VGDDEMSLMIFDMYIDVYIYTYRYNAQIYKYIKSMVYTQRDIHPSWGWVYQVGLDGRAAFCRQAGFSSQRLLCKHVVCASMLFGRLIRDLQVELGPLGVDCVSLGRSSPTDNGGCVFFLPVIRLFHLWSGLIITSAAKHPIFAVDLQPASG